MERCLPFSTTLVHMKRLRVYCIFAIQYQPHARVQPRMRWFYLIVTLHLSPPQNISAYSPRQFALSTFSFFPLSFVIFCIYVEAVFCYFTEVLGHHCLIVFPPPPSYTPYTSPAVLCVLFSYHVKKRRSALLGVVSLPTPVVFGTLRADPFIHFVFLY